MKGTEHAVVYSEYSGDTVLNEQERCLIDNVHKKGLEDWNVGTFAKKGTETKLNMNGVDEFWGTMWTADQINKLGLKYKNKGEENLKIIVKSKETGEQKCIDIPKERENDSGIKALKVGMTVTYAGGNGFESVEIVKIVDNRPKVEMPPHWTPFPWQKGLGYLQAQCIAPKGAGRGTFTKNFLDSLIKQNEAREERKKYREKPYFNVKLDPIKGQSDGIENLEKMKFPCWCVWKYIASKQDHIGMLVTSFPDCQLEYQLIDMERQSGVRDCCSVDRNESLEALMERWHIRVIKGESQCWKVGQFNV